MSYPRSEFFQDDFVDELVALGSTAVTALDSPAFNLDSGLSSWVSDLGSGREHIFITGDSNTVAYYDGTYSWAEGLREDLIAFTGLSDGGVGFRHFGLPEWEPQVGAEYLVGPTNSANNLAPNGETLNIAFSEYIDWIKPAQAGTVTRFEYWGVHTGEANLDNNPRSAIDGGAASSISVTYSGDAPNLVRAEVAASVSTSLRLQGPGGFSASLAAGGAFYNGTTGLAVHNLAGPGVDTKTAVGLSPADHLALWDELQPKLTIFVVGGADFLQSRVWPERIREQTRLSLFEALYREAIERARTHGDVLLVAPVAFKQPSSMFDGDAPISVAEYQRVMRRLAWEYDCGFVSLSAALGGWGRMQARGFVYDPVHLAEAGHLVVQGILKRSIETHS